MKTAMATMDRYNGIEGPDEKKVRIGEGYKLFILF